VSKTKFVAVFRLGVWFFWFEGSDFWDIFIGTGSGLVMLGRLKNILESGKRKSKIIKIMSPLSGTAVALSQVNDPAFSEEMLGKGFAVIPEDGHVVSPVNGTVNQMFDTSHAVSLISCEGAEVLIHVGLDTVKLKGEHFTALAKTGNKVRVGDALIDFDIKAIKAMGYDIITPVVVCNSDDYKQFEMPIFEMHETQKEIDVKFGDQVITLGG
jgi:PTS system beta-glucosides-specific IIC component